jgi:hypothetical protein
MKYRLPKYPAKNQVSRSDGKPMAVLMEEKERAYQRLRRPRERKRDD